MYMRYSGNGIGHDKVDLANDAKMVVPNPDDAEDEIGVVEETRVQEIVVGEAEYNGSAPLEDTHDVDEGEEEEDSDTGNDHWGAEDGEGGFVDLEDEEGYAPL